MKIHTIQEEIHQLKMQVALLESRLKEIQQSCDHHYKRNQYYETCMKCNKVNVLYY
jgi:hypothetical protein